MADTRISALPAITAAETADADLLPIVDQSAGANRKMTFGEAKAALSVDAQAAQAAAESAQAAAELAETNAEAARDAANTSGRVFADTTAGIAGTTSGQTFSVFSGDYIIQYRNDAGVATEVGRFYVKSFFDALFDSDYGDTTEFIYAIIDSAKRRLATWKTDGTLLAKLGIDVGVANGITFTHNADGSCTLSLGTVEGTLPFGDSLAVGGYDHEDYLYAVTDSAGRRLLAVTLDGTLEAKFTIDETTLAVSSEVTVARGSRASLDARVSQHLSDHGQPIRHLWGEWYLRETRYRTRKLLMAETAQLVVASIGDSWTHNRDRYTGPLAAALQSEFGDAGPGWTGFGYLLGIYLNGNVDSTEVGVAFAGTWDYSVYYSSPSPDLGQSTSTTVGSKITVTGPASCSSVRLFWIGTGAGALRYRWDGGAWTALDVTGSGLLTGLLTGLPATAWTLEIEHVSGTVTLCGLDIQKTSNGVRFHKLGATGSSSSSWISPTAAQWQAGMTALAPNLVTIMLGTNDQAGLTPAQFDTNLRALIARVKAALPLADVMLVQPCENGRTNTYAMSLYTEKAYIAAADLKCAFLDLQYLFGDEFSEYASTSARAWFSSDLIHPDPTTGGRVITDAIARVLTNV